MEFNKLLSSLESGQISPYQIYNLDIDYPQIFGVEHYIKNKNDNIDVNQNLHKLFLDIEVYARNDIFDFDKIDEGRFPISCITIYSSNEKIFHVFTLINKENVDSWNSRNDHIDYFKKQIIENEYLPENEFDITVKTYNSDMSLIKDCWNKIHELDPIIISGFNSDGFDLPYIYYRLKNLYNGDLKSVSKILSKFGDVNISNWGGSRGKVRLVEYINMDIQYLFKPRSDGGLNLGSVLASYSLDFVSESILRKKKIEYKNQNLTLDQFFVQDAVNYTLYNIVDVVLCVLLEQKLKLIDQYNLYRRLMYSTASESLRGSTALFDTLVFYNLSIKKEAVGFGITDETISTIDKSEIDKIPKPLTTKNIKWSINSIDQRTYLKITRKFEGAYVKDSPSRVFDTSGGLIIDLDANRLYPSMIIQNNISFDTYFGRIIDPFTTEKVIALIDNFLKNKKDPQIKTIYSSFLDLCSRYIESDKITTQNKSEATQQYYYIISYLFSKIINSNVSSLKEIFQPKDYYGYILLKKYLIPFINLIDEINPLNENVELNTFCYEYLLNDQYTHKSIYIIENINQPNIRIIQLLAETLDEYLKKNQLIITLTGCLFYQHKKKISLFSNWLENMYKMRKEYIKERDKKLDDRDSYNFYDARQSTTKIAMNTAYGLFGQATYRYSNNWLAKTITCQGRLTLKISQQVADQYLKELDSV